MRCVERPELIFNTQVATRFGDRLIGLLRSRQPPEKGQGLLLSPGGSVHGMGMRRAFEVIHLSENLEVLAHVRVDPWGASIAPLQTHQSLEIACHQIHESILGYRFREEAICHLS